MNIELNIILDVNHGEDKTREEVEGATYWLLQTFLEQFKARCYDGCSIDNFNIVVL